MRKSVFYFLFKFIPFWSHSRPIQVHPYQVALVGALALLSHAFLLLATQFCLLSSLILFSAPLLGGLPFAYRCRNCLIVPICNFSNFAFELRDFQNWTFSAIIIVVLVSGRPLTRGSYFGAICSLSTLGEHSSSSYRFVVLTCLHISCRALYPSLLAWTSWPVINSV